MKTIIYSRVSTERQTLDQQERTVLQWLEKNGLQPSLTISDEGVSGAVSYKDRNLGKIVLPLLEKGDILIVSEISRLGRSMSDINKLVTDELRPRGVRLVVVQMGIDLNCAEIKALDEMLLFAFGFAAQLEKELIQSRTQSAIEVRKTKLRENGSFISKSGNTCTHLGRAKGCDTTSASDASAIARRERARQNPTNKIIWGILSENKPANMREYEQAANRLNSMGVKTSTGLPFTPTRAASAYHNLRRIYAQ